MPFQRLFLLWLIFWRITRTPRLNTQVSLLLKQVATLFLTTCSYILLVVLFVHALLLKDTFPVYTQTSTQCEGYLLAIIYNNCQLESVPPRANFFPIWSIDVILKMKTWFHIDLLPRFFATLEKMDVLTFFFCLKSVFGVSLRRCLDAGTTGLVIVFFSGTASA